MSTWTDRIPVDEISARARQVRFTRVLATLATGFFWFIGWLAAFAWVSVVYCALSIRYGYQSGHAVAKAAILGEPGAGPS